MFFGLPMIEFKNISIAFAEKIIFQNFNLKINNLERIGLKGKSGLGKSTLINLIMGIKQADSGTIIIDGYEIKPSNIKQIREKIAWLPQNISSIGTGNISIIFKKIFSFAQNKHLNMPDLSAECEKLGLNINPETSIFEDLSGGERQKLGLIICKWLNRDIILLDEPSSALDEDSIALAADYIFDMPQSTIISISHDNRWLKFCSRIIDIENAR